MTDQLRLADARAVIRLVGECRDLGADFPAWKAHLQAGVGRLVGTPLGIGAAATSAASDGRVETVRTFGTGWPSAEAAAAWVEFDKAGGHNDDPVVRRLAAAGLGLRTWTRDGVVTEAEWYRSYAYEHLCRPHGIDRCLMSLEPTGHGVDFLVLFREKGARRFGGRERAIVRLCHEEVGRLIGGPLVAAGTPQPSDLSPRLRTVLDGLLGGLSEKQVARRLGIAPATAHGYVLQVYRHFRVGSRPALMAHFLGRGAPPPASAPT